MNTLLYALELLLIFHPTAYYIPALETDNPAVVLFCILLNIAFVASLKFFIRSFKRKA